MNVRAAVVGGVTLAMTVGTWLVAVVPGSEPAFDVVADPPGSGRVTLNAFAVPRPLLVTQTCRVDRLEVKMPGLAAAGQPFTITAEPVNDEVATAAMSCPVHMQLTSSSPSATIAGPQPTDVIDLGVARGEWAVTVPEPQRITFTVSASAVDRCTAACLVPDTESIVVVVEPNRAVAALRAQLTSALDLAAIAIDQDGPVHAGTPSHIEIAVRVPLHLVPADEVTVRLKPTDIPGGDTVGERRVSGRPVATATFDAIVTPLTEASFDSLVDLTLAATADGQPVEVTRQVLISVRVQRGNRVMGFLRSNVPWIVPLLGGGGLLGMWTTRRRKQPAEPDGPAADASGASEPG